MNTHKTHSPETGKSKFKMNVIIFIWLQLHSCFSFLIARDQNRSNRNKIQEGRGKKGENAATPSELLTHILKTHNELY